jgi:hypothetical protein
MSNSSVWGDADDAIARVNSQVVEAQERAAKARELRESMDALKVTAASPRGEVVAKVDVTGRLIDLELDSSAMNLTPTALAALIVKTAAAAAAKAGQQAVELAAESFGEESPITARLRDEVGSRGAAEDGLAYR